MNHPAECGHLLTDQLAGQTDARSAIVGLFKGSQIELKISEYIPTYIATRAVKL